jgi:hypothetical protein
MQGGRPSITCYVMQGGRPSITCYVMQGGRPSITCYARHVHPSSDTRVVHAAWLSWSLYPKKGGARHARVMAALYLSLGVRRVPTLSPCA